MNKKIISVILPVLNEQHNIPLIYQKLKTVFDTQLPEYTYEMCFINDGSTDNSWPIIQELAAKDISIKALSFSRNFGYQTALTAGYDTVQGDAIISMDSDLQHPPELIPDFIKCWQLGAKIVYARRIGRKDTWFKRVTAAIFHRLLNKISHINIPHGVSDFRLIDASVHKVISSYRNESPFWRGVIAWTGFKPAYVDFYQPNRIHGFTGYTWSKLIRIAFDGITGFSLVPLRMAAFWGIFMMCTGFMMSCYLMVRIMLDIVQYPLFKMLVIVMYMFMGIQFLLLWILGEYIGRIAQAQINRPLYIINQSINMKESNAIQSHALSMGTSPKSVSGIS